jgi:methionyl aminopeptidase
MAITLGDHTIVSVAREALWSAIYLIKPGTSVATISKAIQSYTERQGYSVIRDYGGHGIGTQLHEAPHIPCNYEGRDESAIIQTGMVLALETMVLQDGYEVITDANGWTVKTYNHRLSAHFEHTLVVTDKGADVLTPLKPKDAGRYLQC